MDELQKRAKKALKDLQSGRATIKSDNKSGNKQAVINRIKKMAGESNGND